MGKSTDLIKSLDQNHLLVSEGLLRRWGMAVDHCGKEDTGGRGTYGGVFIGMSSPRSHHSGTKT